MKLNKLAEKIIWQQSRLAFKVI